MFRILCNITVRSTSRGCGKTDEKSKELLFRVSTCRSGEEQRLKEALIRWGYRADLMKGQRHTHTGS